MPKRPRPTEPHGTGAAGSKPGKSAAKESDAAAAGKPASKGLGGLSFDELLTSKFGGASGKPSAAGKPGAAKPEAPPKPSASRLSATSSAISSSAAARSKGNVSSKAKSPPSPSSDDDDDVDEEAEEEDADGASDDDAGAGSGSDAESGSDSGSDSGDDLPDMATFSKQLAGMAKSDPDFYNFLAKNDRKLLKAAENAADEEDEDDDEDAAGAGGGDDEDEEDDDDALDGEDEGALDGAAAFGDGEDEESDADDGAAGRKSKAKAKGKAKAKAAASSDEDDDEDDDEEDEEEEEEEEEAADEDDDDALNGARHGPPELTAAMARAIARSAFDAKTFRGLARMLHAYRACAYMGTGADILSQLGIGPGADAAPGAGGSSSRKGGKKDGKGDRSARRHTAEDDSDEDDGEGGRRRAVSLRYRIPSSGVFMAVVQGMLERGPAALAHHLGHLGKGKEKGKDKSSDAAAAGGAGGELGPAPRTDLAEYSGWSKLEPLARSLLTATLELLKQAKDGSLRGYILRCLRPLVPYLAPFSALTRRYIRTLLTMFAGGRSADAETAQSLIVASFLRLRQMGSSLPHPTLDAVLKGLYRTYVGGAARMSEEGAPSVLVQAHCVAEAFGIDEVAAYQHAFTYLRQLALQLRTALTTKSKEAVLAVYSWQYINCCRVWTSVLCRYGADPSRPLFQLVFPLVQTLLGVARLVPTPRFFPLRLHCASMLAELSWATRVYIPVAPLLLDILASPTISAKPSAATAAGGKAPALSFMVKVGKSSLGARAVTDAIVNRTLDVLLDTVKASYHSVALPELVLPIVAGLRAFAKGTRVAAWRGRARALADAFAGQGAKVAAKRAALGVAPSDRAAVARFMSAEGDAAAAERLRSREAAASAALTEAHARAELAKREAAAAARAGRSRDDDGDGDEDEDEDDAALFGNAVKRPRVARHDDDDDEDEDGDAGEEDDGDDAAVGGAGAAPKGKHVSFAAKAGPMAGPKGKGGYRKLASASSGGDLVEDLNPDDL